MTKTQIEMAVSNVANKIVLPQSYTSYMMLTPTGEALECRDDTIKILGDPIILPRVLTEKTKMALSNSFGGLKHDFQSEFSSWLYFFLRGFADASGDKTPFLLNIERNNKWHNKNKYKIWHPAGRLWHLHDLPYEHNDEKIDCNKDIALYKSRVVPIIRKKDELLWYCAFRDIHHSMKSLNL